MAEVPQTQEDSQDLTLLVWYIVDDDDRNLALKHSSTPNRLLGLGDTSGSACVQAPRQALQTAAFMMKYVSRFELYQAGSAVVYTGIVSDLFLSFWEAKFKRFIGASPAVALAQLRGPETGWSQCQPSFSESMCLTFGCWS